MPIPLIVILAILLFFVLLLLLPVRIVITCRETVVLRLKILFVTVPLFPRHTKPASPRNYTPRRMARKRRRAEKRAARKARRAAKKAEKSSRAADTLKKRHTPSPAPTLRENIRLVRALVAALVRKTGKHLHLRVARLHVRVATGDAATTAILYGGVCASLAYLLAALDRVTALKAHSRETSVFADYLSEKSSIDLKLIFSLRVWGALALLFSAALTFIKTRRQQKAARRKAAAK